MRRNNCNGRHWFTDHKMTHAVAPGVVLSLGKTIVAFHFIFEQ
jgi:hypothetical protein